MSLETWGDGDVPAPCEECLRLEDLVGAVKKIAATQVYKGGKKGNGISVELIAAISAAFAIAIAEDGAG